MTKNQPTQAEVARMRAALLRAKRLFEKALPEFNWGASALSAESIVLLNEVPGEVAKALEGKGDPQGVRDLLLEAIVRDLLEGDAEWTAGKNGQAVIAAARKTSYALRAASMLLEERAKKGGPKP